MKYENSILNVLTIFILSLLFVDLHCSSVCDLELYILELKQDLDDNGILDCLRTIKPPNGVIESPEQKNKRLAAQWDTSCAFESNLDWASQLKRNYDITPMVHGRI